LDTAASDAATTDAPPAGFLQSRTFAVVRIAVTVAIVAGLVYRLSPGELRDTVRDADPWLLLGAAAVAAAVQLMVLAKWAYLLRARGVRAPLLLLARMYALGNILSNVLPTAIGGDVYRIYRVQREADARAADVTMSVLYERATGYGAMTCFGALGAAFYFGSPLIGALALAGGVVAAALLALLLPRVPLPALREDHPLRNLLAHRGELLAVYRMTVFSLPIQALYISTIALIGLAFGAHVSWWYWAFTTWVVALAVLAPITLGGLGVRESSFSALLASAGATAAQGASVGFTLAVVLIAVNLAGLACVEAYERAQRARAAEPLPAPARG
jgi:uncharacterized membrane protein YbhN (UPF0104 family)